MDRWGEFKRWLIETQDESIDRGSILKILAKMREIEENDRREYRAIYYTSFDGEE